jgi:hypothetical protein
VYCEDYAGYYTVILLFLAFRFCSAYFIYLVSCINVDEDDDPRKVNIKETEGQRDVEGPGVEIPFIEQPINITNVNIGTEQTSNLANVRDYWDVATIDKIRELLHEYQDLFPTKFTDMKGIKGPMGEMRIPLKPDARSVK